MKILTLQAPSRQRLYLMLAALTLAVAGAAAQTAMASPHGGMRGGMDHGPGMELMAPRHLDRMLDGVQATAEQREQIGQIVRAARQEMQAQREAGQALREQARSLFVQPTVDAEAAEALRQQMLVQHDAASKRGLQALLDVSRVLTPEQGQSLAERMSQRRTAMEGRRAEREAARPAPAR